MTNILWWIAIHVTTVLTHSHFSYTPLTKELGIYFEQVSTLRLYHSEWNIVTYINITALEEEWVHIQSMVSKADQLCEQIEIARKTIAANASIYQKQLISPLSISCGPMRQQLTKLLQEVQEYNSEHFHSRQRRGLLNVVGEISKNLFGTISKSDGTMFLEKFHHLFRLGRIRDTITKKQTTLIQSNLNLITETRNQSQTRDNQLEELIKSRNHTLQELNKQFQYFSLSLILKTQIQDTLTFIILLLISFQEKQKRFLQALSIGTKGGNSPIIIPPEVLYAELEHIRTALASQPADLPIALTKDILHLFYQIASHKSRLMNNQLIISMTIPLTEMGEYNLYKVTSFPHRLPNGLFHFIVPQHEYVAVSRFRQSYIPFTNQALTNCHTIYINSNQTVLTCMLLSPILDITVDRYECEVTLLTKDLISKNCNIRVANITSEVWIKLRQPNTKYHPSNHTDRMRQFVGL